VPDALRGHLDACPDCVRWWRRVARLERLLSELPAPPAPAGKKEAMLDELTAAGPVIKAVPAVGRSVPSPGLAFLRRNWKPVAGLAAAVLVVIGGWQLFGGRGGNGHVAKASTPPHPLLSKLVDRDVEIAAAKGDPEKRLQALGGLAGDLAAETRDLARVSSAGEVDYLARWFEKTVDGGIVPQAKGLATGRTLTPAERDARVKLLTDMAVRLSETATEVNGLVMQSPEKARPGLNRIAEKAQSGHDILQNLARGM
jgi:hypothetical protein